MYESKAPASLTAGLLARKGQARPALLPALSKEQLDNAPYDVPSSPRQTLLRKVMPGDVMAAPELERPSPVTAAQAELEARLAESTHATAVAMAPDTVDAQAASQMSPAAVEPVSAFTPVAKVPAVRAAPGSKGRSAFTLRLDAERHLKLRLLSARRHVSAQNLVIQALDQFFAQTSLELGEGQCLCKVEKK